jgi:hypothetical protein
MTSAQLVRYDAMCTAIDAAYRVDEVKDIRDKAVALEHYARQAKNTEAERKACEVRLRAERKAGKLLKTMQKANGARGVGKKVESPKGTPLLADLNISAKQSSNWQKLGDIPQRDFDRALRDAERPTTAGIIRAVTPPSKPRVHDHALWLWGRLRDFKEYGLLDKEPADVTETMTAHMKDEVHALAPKVAAWLKRIGGKPQ